MKERTFYTAVGHFCRKKDGNGQSFPVVIVNRKEHILDIQETAIWTTLCWSMMDIQKLEMKYDQIMAGQPAQRRSFEFCVERLQTRGLVASGTGKTDFDAIYDLLGGLYVVPISEHLPLRTITFLKLILIRGVSWKRACILFQHDCRNEREEQVMALSKQALLSTAELIKCAEGGIDDVSTDEKLLNALYSDADSTSENLPDMMRGSAKQLPITLAITNLYLRKQIILERL